MCAAPGVTGWMFAEPGVTGRMCAAPGVTGASWVCSCDTSRADAADCSFLAFFVFHLRCETTSQEDVEV